MYLTLVYSTIDTRYHQGDTPMKAFEYYAIINSDLEDDCYLVRFPNLENVCTDGETLLKYVKHAKEVLK